MPKFRSGESTSLISLLAVFNLDEVLETQRVQRKCSKSKKCPNAGWKFSGATKQKVRGAKRKATMMNIDLQSFKPHPIGNTKESLQTWLADSKPAWDQLRTMLRIKRQVSKKHKTAR